MAGQVKADGLVFLGQPLVRQPVRGVGQARFGKVVAGLAEQRHLVGIALFMDRGGIGHQRIEAFKDAAAVAVELIEGPGAGQHFQRALADAFQVDPARDIEERGKGLVVTALLDQAHGLHAHVLQPAQRVDDLSVLHGKGRGRAVHAGRDRLDIEPVDLLLVDD